MRAKLSERIKSAYLLTDEVGLPAPTCSASAWPPRRATDADCALMVTRALARGMLLSGVLGNDDHFSARRDAILAASPMHRRTPMGYVLLRWIALIAGPVLLLTACNDDASPRGATAEEVASKVIALQTARNGASAAVAAERAGYWQGTLVAGGLVQHVSGVATAEGLVLLRSEGVRPDTYLLRDLVRSGERYSGRVWRTRADGSVQELGLEGPWQTGRFLAVLLPPGWTLAEQLAGSRSVSAAEQPLFGSLRLERVDPAAALDALPAGRLVDSEAASAFMIEVSVAGELVAKSAGCRFDGGLSPSRSVAGVLEVAGTATGTNCALIGELTGVVIDRGDGRLSLQSTDGQRSLQRTLLWSPP
jgi:hypothetical protein